MQNEIEFRPNFVLTIRIVQVIFIFSLASYKDMLGGEYQYPDWSINVGWVLTGSSVICIPVYIVYKLCITPGKFIHVSTQY
jgi:hypothetical protein